MPKGRRRGRGRTSKLTPLAIAEIRAWYDLYTSLPSATDMAAKYGVCNETIYQIGRGLLHKRPEAQRNASMIYSADAPPI